MKTHVCRNSYMRHSDLKSGVVFTTPRFTTFSNNTCGSKSQRKTRPTLQIISRVRFLFVTNVVQMAKSKRCVWTYDQLCAQISGGGCVHWDLAAHWMLWRSGPRHTAVSTVPQ
jgi:hypothetical protein